MKLIVLLSKENIDLAREEAASLLDCALDSKEDILVGVGNPDLLARRLGFSHSIFMLLFSCKEEELEASIEKFDWRKHYKESFCVRTHNSKEKLIAAKIYERLVSPKVDLKNPGTRFEFLFRKGIAYAGLFVSDVDKSYVKRKAHLKPRMHPTGLSPGLARACINLTGLEKGKLLDPFCGAGGILVEAGIMGFSVFGCDFDYAQVERAKENLRHYNIGAEVVMSDALEYREKADAIVTDLPYGKGSKVSSKDLYLKFLEHAKLLTDNMCIIFPDFASPSGIIEKSGWEIKQRFKVYVHKSLSREIFILHLPCLRS